MTRRRVLVTVGCALSLVAPAAAQLAVFDPVNYAEAVLQLTQLEQSYAQLIQVYGQVRAQYQHLVAQAKRVPVDMSTRYRGLRTPWRALAGADTYGAATPWIDAANTGWDVAAAYQSASQALRAYDGGLGTLPPEVAPRVRTAYGTIELTDAVTTQGLWTAGRLRNHSGAVEDALRALEDDSYSTSDAMNTQIAVLNKINAAGVSAIRMAQDTNDLLLSVLEGQLVAAKRQRDVDVERINADVAFARDARALLTRTTAGTTDALQRFSLP